MNAIELFIKELEEIGFFPYIIILLLVTPIVYGLLRRSKIFGEPKEAISINASISIAIALSVMASPILLGINIQTQLLKFFLFVVILLLILLLLIFSLSFIAPEGNISKLFEEKVGKLKVMWIMVILVLIITFSILTASGIFSFINFSQIKTPSEDILSIIILVLVFAFLGFIIWFVTRD